MKCFLLSTVLFMVARCASGIDASGNALNENDDGSEQSLMLGLRSRCGVHEPSSCIALELIGYVDRMLHTAAFQLGDDVLIMDESDGAAAQKPISSESLARAGKSLESQAQQLIMDKLYVFASTRSLRWRLIDDTDLVIGGAPEADGGFNLGVSLKSAKAVETGRGKYKNMGPLLAAAAMKIGIMGGLAFKGLVLLVGKALLISKVALLLASIIGLKKLFSQQVD